jgi:hypothetical protein
MKKQERKRRTETAKAKAPAVPAAKPKAAKAGKPKLEKKRSLHAADCPCGWCRLRRGEPHRDDCKCKKCKDKRMEVAQKAAVKKPGKAPAAKGEAL